MKMYTRSIEKLISLYDIYHILINFFSFIHNAAYTKKRQIIKFFIIYSIFFFFFFFFFINIKSTISRHFIFNLMIMIIDWRWIKTSFSHRDITIQKVMEYNAIFSSSSSCYSFCLYLLWLRSLLWFTSNWRLQWYFTLNDKIMINRIAKTAWSGNIYDYKMNIQKFQEAYYLRFSLASVLNFGNYSLKALKFAVFIFAW